MKFFALFAAIAIVTFLVVFSVGNAVYFSDEGDTNGTGSANPQTAMVVSSDQVPSVFIS